MIDGQKINCNFWVSLLTCNDKSARPNKLNPIISTNAISPLCLFHFKFTFFFYLFVCSLTCSLKMRLIYFLVSNSYCHSFIHSFILSVHLSVCPSICSFIDKLIIQPLSAKIFFSFLKKSLSMWQTNANDTKIII